MNYSLRSCKALSKPSRGKSEEREDQNARVLIWDRIHARSPDVSPPKPRFSVRSGKLAGHLTPSRTRSNVAEEPSVYPRPNAYPACGADRHGFILVASPHRRFPCSLHPRAGGHEG